MGMFDGLLGGVIGGAMVSVVNSIIEQHGGIQGIVGQFEKNGLGATVKSWVSTGANQPISSEDLQRALGPEMLQQLSQKTGMSVDDLARKLTEVLPVAIDKMTPNGTVPPSK